MIRLKAPAHLDMQRRVSESADTLVAVERAIAQARASLDAQENAIAITCAGTLSGLLSERLLSQGLYARLRETKPVIRHAMLSCLQAVRQVRRFLSEVDSPEFAEKVGDVLAHCARIETAAHSQMSRTELAALH